MCGIGGFVGFSDFDPMSAERRVAGVIERLRHRGPDGSALRATTSALFGCARLIVRGPRGGNQPLAGPGGRLVVCNGEIDNHRELRDLLERLGHRVDGASDVDVLPLLFAEFGERAIEMIEGPFALASWDPNGRKLVLARDPAGERPLFFRQAAGETWFASEIGALVGDPEIACEIDREAIYGFLSRGYFASPDSPVRGVSKVAPGELVEIGERGISRRRYWSWEPGVSGGKAPSAEEFSLGFRAAVARQVAVDVPYGVLLSGGLDSSLVAAIALESAATAPQAAFCLRFREPSYDEGSRARYVANWLGLPLEEVWAGARDSAQMLEELISTAGEPLADPAWAPTAMLARRAAERVRMVLCGEGGDEVMGGYPTYPGIRLARGVARLPSVARSVLRSAALRLPDSERKITVAYLLKRFARCAELAPVARHQSWTACIDGELLSDLGLDASHAGRPEEVESGVLSRIQKLDFEGLLADGLMTKSDRAAMRFGLEVRSPFLDRRLLGVAAAIPERERVRGLRTKVFLKRFASSVLPRSVVHARKRGLSVPVSSWLRAELVDWAGDRLSDPLLRNVGIDPKRTMALFDAHVERRADHGRSLWALAVLATWLRWFESRAGASADGGQVAVARL